MRSTGSPHVSPVTCVDDEDNGQPNSCVTCGCVSDPPHKPWGDPVEYVYENLLKAAATFVKRLRRVAPSYVILSATGFPVRWGPMLCGCPKLS